MNKLLKVCVLCSFTLSGCGNWFKSNYQQPVLSIPTQWTEHDNGRVNNSLILDNINDPLLSRIIKEALKSNADLARAGINLKKARLQAGIINTNLTPDVTVTGSANNNTDIHSLNDKKTTYSSSLELSYEIDLWGKLSRMREQAQWEVNVSEQEKQEIYLTLIGDTARYYWQIANMNQQIKQQKQGISLARKTLEIIRLRHNTGDASQLDIVQAKQSVIEKISQLRELEYQREESRNALALLFNRRPHDWLPEKDKFDTAQDVSFSVRLPVETIARRPDVRAAEGQLRAALAGSDVARLSFYPDISLNASLGATSMLFKQWFSDPTATYGVAVSLPFLQWNKVRMTIEQSRLDVQIAAVNFRSKVYNALSEVENAFALRKSSSQQRQLQQRLVALDEDRVRIAMSRYQAGEVSFQTWLDAQESLLANQQLLSESQYNYYCASMKLWLALGG